MKKFFMIAVMAISALAANAQTPAAGSITVVPKVGINFSTIDGNTDNDMKVGFAAGAEGLYMIDDMFGISAGVMYSQQGAKQELTKGLDATLKADYINIPIMANSYLAPGLAVKIGVQPGFKVNEELKLSTNEHSGSAETKQVDSFDLSIPVGVSYEFSNIVLDARYNWGVTNMYKDKDSKAHNSVFQLTLGYRF